MNGFKISERTIYGCMDDKEMVALFTGYGYQPRFVEDLEDIDTDLGQSMIWALGEIKKIQKAARTGKPILKPRWPVLIMRTPKGWTGPQKVHGEFIEGSFKAHQVPLMKAKSDKSELLQLQEWLGSYVPHEMFNKNGGLHEAITRIIPNEDGKKLGQQIDTYGSHEVLHLPDWKKYGLKKGGTSSNTVNTVLPYIWFPNLLQDKRAVCRSSASTLINPSSITQAACGFSLRTSLSVTNLMPSSTIQPGTSSGTNSLMHEVDVSSKYCLNTFVKASSKAGAPLFYSSLFSS